MNICRANNENLFGALVGSLPSGIKWFSICSWDMGYFLRELSPVSRHKILRSKLSNPSTIFYFRFLCSTFLSFSLDFVRQKTQLYLSTGILINVALIFFASIFLNLGTQTSSVLVFYLRILFATLTTLVITITTFYVGYILKMDYEFKRHSKYRSKSLRNQFIELLQHIQVAIGIINTQTKIAFHTRLSGRTTGIKSK